MYFEGLNYGYCITLHIIKLLNNNLSLIVEESFSGLCPRTTVFQCFADDTQFYIAVNPTNPFPTGTLIACIHDISTWLNNTCQ